MEGVAAGRFLPRVTDDLADETDALFTRLHAACLLKGVKRQAGQVSVGKKGQVRDAPGGVEG